MKQISFRLMLACLSFAIISSAVGADTGPLPAPRHGGSSTIAGDWVFTITWAKEPKEILEFIFDSHGVGVKAVPPDPAFFGGNLGTNGTVDVNYQDNFGTYSTGFFGTLKGNLMSGTSSRTIYKNGGLFLLDTGTFTAQRGAGNGGGGGGGAPKSKTVASLKIQETDTLYSIGVTGSTTEVSAQFRLAHVNFSGEMDISSVTQIIDQTAAFGIKVDSDLYAFSFKDDLNIATDLPQNKITVKLPPFLPDAFFSQINTPKPYAAGATPVFASFQLFQNKDGSNKSLKYKIDIYGRVSINSTVKPPIIVSEGETGPYIGGLGQPTKATITSSVSIAFLPNKRADKVNYNFTLDGVLTTKVKGGVVQTKPVQAAQLTVKGTGTLTETLP